MQNFLECRIGRMKQLLIMCVIVSGMFMVFSSCKKVEEIHAYMSEEESLGRVMKRTSRDTRRLTRALEAGIADAEFNKMIKSCDDCHEGY